MRTHAIHPELATPRKVGAVLLDLIERHTGTDAVMFVAPNESLLSNHVRCLALPLVADTSLACASVAAILDDGSGPIHGVHEVLDFGHFNPAGPTGYARFLFRLSDLPRDLHLALPYLDGRPLAVLLGKQQVRQLAAATLTIYLRTPFPNRRMNESVENAIIWEYAPQALRISAGFLAPPPMPAPVTVAPPEFTLLNLLRMLGNPSWLKAQLIAIRAKGLRARVGVLCRKLGL
jgi:hypothetical protein